MKTFEEMLPTATAEMREFVEAYQAEVEQWHQDDRRAPIEQMRATPPAKEPVCIRAIVSKDSRDLFSVVWPNQEWPKGFEIGEDVRVTKLEDGR